MTYTVIALDRSTGQLGIGIATYSLAVGASCPYVRSGVGAVSTQAATFPAHGPALLEMIERGVEVSDAFTRLAAVDAHFDYRQIGVVTATGTAHVHTGGSTRGWAGSLIGDGWLVMGNVLAGEYVTAAMGSAMRSYEGKPLADHLIAALEAGRDAGGQVGIDGRHLPERSAVITIYGEESFAALDLRVDDHPDAVTEMRRVFDRFVRVSEYYRDRADRPDETVPQDQWMAEHGME